VAYDSVREQLKRAQQALVDRDEETRRLTEALEQLNKILESDLTQIKAALSHLARLFELPGNTQPFD
jgi:hypothetical protein